MATINCYDVNGDAIRFLTQWDHDISIRATGVKTSPIPEFRFSNKHSQKSKCISGVVVGDGVKATIPNGFLQEALPIYVQLFYIYPSGDAKTEHTFVIPVKPASMPDGAVYEPVEVRSIVELEKRVKALEENGVPGAGGVPSDPSFDTVSLGGDAGVVIIPEGTAGAPAIAFYGAHGDEPVALNNVADATDDRSAPNLGQVKQLVEQHSGQNPPQDGENGATFTPAVSADGTLSWSNDKGLDNPAPVNIKGPHGVPGADGYTPQKGVDYFDGENGKDGSPGKDGVDGNGIKSAVLNADYTLTLTFDNGTSYTTPSIRGATGATGSAGKDGSDGAAGKDGTSVTVKSVSESAADGGSNVITFSDGKTVTIKNGSKGSTGATGGKGADGHTPVKGVDYWTPADQEAIVQQVIAALGTPVFGRVDADNNIILTGELVDGTYTVKYEDGEGSVTEIGTIDLGAPSVFDVPLTWNIGVKLNKNDGTVESTNDPKYNASDVIPLVSGAHYVVATTNDCYNKMGIVYYNDNDVFVGYQDEAWAARECEPDEGQPASADLVIPAGATKIRLRQYEVWNTHGGSTKFVTLTGTL